MTCEQCDKVCKRRGVAMSPHHRSLCDTSQAYAQIFDKKHGVTDSYVVPQSLQQLAIQDEAPIRRARKAARRQKRRSCGNCGTSRGRRALNFAKAMAHWAADGGKTTSEAVRERRLALCEDCPLFNGPNRQCTACGCHVDAKVALRREVCPAGKWLQETDNRRPLTNPTRHLIYHLYPVAGNGWWQWNVAELIKRVELFDGVRSVAVLTQERNGTPLDSVETVQAAFAGHRIDNWIIKQNDPKFREVVTHKALLGTLPRGDRQITFSGHAKGGRHGAIGDYAGTVQDWTRIMYEVCLDDPAAVDVALEDFQFVGSLHQFNSMACHGWHYSGTFYWLRNDAGLLDRGLTSKRWWGTESWPGDACEHYDAGCLFGDGVDDLYQHRVCDPITETFKNIWKESRRD